MFYLPTKVCYLPVNYNYYYYITPKCIDTNSYYITPICIHLQTIINALNATGDAYSLEISPFLLVCVATCICFVFVLVFFYLLKLVNKKHKIIKRVNFELIQSKYPGLPFCKNHNTKHRNWNHTRATKTSTS